MFSHRGRGHNINLLVEADERGSEGLKLLFLVVAYGRVKNCDEDINVAIWVRVWKHGTWDGLLRRSDMKI